jgi:hypothetical protein
VWTVVTVLSIPRTHEIKYLAGITLGTSAHQ